MKKWQRWLKEAANRVSVWGVCMLGAACGGDSGPFEPNTFAGMYEEQIVYDCKHTQDCKRMMPDMESVSYEECHRKTADTLEMNPERRAQYLTDVRACGQLTACAYYRCTRTQRPPFSTVHAQEIDIYCRHWVDCRVQRGTFAGDAATEIQACVSATGLQLETEADSVRQGFVDSYAECNMLSGCEFSDCVGWTMPAPAP